MESAPLLQSSSDDAHSLLDAAKTKWERPVPQCPGWDAAALVGHTGGILQWMAAVVASRDRVSRRSLDSPPRNPVDLSSWYLDSLDRTLDVLASTDPGSETWTFSSTGERRVSWWCRRLAVEVAMHRWDIEHAVASDGGPSPGAVDGEAAGAGVEEFVVDFLPGLLATKGTDRFSGTLHLHAVDGPTEWWIDLDAGGLSLPEHAEADAALQGTRSDLLLWLTNRRPVENLTVLGDQAVTHTWGQLSR
jgi:uncharacterized protein (TIGR03083 family)